MRRLLSLTGAFVVAGTLVARAAGPVYTIPADYEKMKKVVEGIVGTSNLQSVDDNTAKNAGANLKAFVEGATGKSTTSTYSPTYFQSYGNNYRQFVANAAATDPGGTTNSARFTYAGRNYRNLAQGMTGLGITDYRYYYYNRAGRNVKNLAEGETGLWIGDYRYWYYRNAGINYRNVAQGLANGQAIYTTPGSRYNNFQQYKIRQFKQRADQTFYDMYINPNGMKKAFSSFDRAVTYKTAGMTPISRYNRVSSLGGDGLEDKAIWKPLGQKVSCDTWGNCVIEGYYVWVKDGYRPVNAPRYNWFGKLVDSSGRTIAIAGGIKARFYFVQRLGNGNVYLSSSPTIIPVNSSYVKWGQTNVLYSKN